MEDSDYYIKLFISLKRKQEKEIWKIWQENIEEKLYHKKKAIKEFCDKENCDFMIALYSILENNLKTNNITIKERKELEKQIIKIAKQRLKNPEYYLDNPLNIPCEKEDFHSLSPLQQLFYYKDNTSSSSSSSSSSQSSLSSSSPAPSLPSQSSSLSSSSSSSQSSLSPLSSSSSSSITSAPLTQQLQKPTPNTSKFQPLNNPLTKKQTKKLFDGLVKLGCIDKENLKPFLTFMNHPQTKESILEPINWQKSKSLCAYFVDIFCFEILKKDRTIWKPFEYFFKLNNLCLSKNDYRKTGTLPKGAKEIMDLIEKLKS